MTYGWLGNLIDAAHDSRMKRSERRQERINRRDSDRLWANQLTIRAADARRAGIHPVFAMGAPTFGPSNKIGAAGTRRGDPGGIIRSKAEHERQSRLDALAADESKSRSAAQAAAAARDYALEQKADSETALNNQKLNSQQDYEVLTLPSGRKIIVNNPGFADNLQRHYGDAIEQLGIMQYEKDFREHIKAQKELEQLLKNRANKPRLTESAKKRLREEKYRKQRGWRFK